MQICATNSIVIVNMPAPVAKREADWSTILKELWRGARRALRWVVGG